ncbi:MAG: GNAT family N-acetyltransferase [Pseudomonadota bacterium]
MASSVGQPPPLSTERLRIRPFVLDDAPFIVALLNDPDFIRHIRDRGVRTLADAREYLAGPLDSYARHGFGLCCVIEVASGQAVGMCGLLQRERLPAPDIGYAFLPAARRKGYAYEAARGVLQFAGAQGIGRVLAITNEHNRASQQLLTKLGFDYLEQVVFDDDEPPVHCYEVRLTPASSE